MTKFVAIIAGLTLVGVLGLVIDAHSRVPAVRPEIPPGECTIFATGRVEGATPEIELRLQLPGRVEELPAREGQLVEKGDLLVRLDDRQYREGVALAAAELALAQAQLGRLVNGARPQEVAEAAALHRARLAETELAQRSWDRTSKLRETRVIVEQEADSDRSRLAALKAEVEAAKARLELLEAPPRQDELHMEQARVQAAKARLELARVQLERTELRAPCSGQVLKIDAEIGELTGPDSADPVVILADTSTVRIRAFVEEMDAPRVGVGMAATVVTDGLPDRRFQGRVVRVSPRMDGKQIWSDQPAERYDTKVREVWIELEGEVPLVIGLCVDAVIDPGTSQSRAAAGR